MNNILLLGSGGREHALALKLSSSPLCKQLFIAPGNPGTAFLGINLDYLATDDFEGIRKAVVLHEINILVVGPEAPLVQGIYDFFSVDPELKNVYVFGPSRAAAQLEGSKAFAKKFMEEMDIPTATYREFSLEQIQQGIKYIKAHTLPIVLKADGLAAGKGVIIAHTHKHAIEEFEAMLQGKFGVAGNVVVIEEYLEGIEVSVFAATNGYQYKLLPSAKDYKRIGEGDQGLNTGGMGAVSPPPILSKELMVAIEDQIVKPTIEGIYRRRMIYHGFVFFGLMIVNNQPFVIEYNCRLGDPETEVILPRITSDLVELILASKDEQLDIFDLKVENITALTLFLVSGGYPEAYKKGIPISGIENIKEAQIFYAGVKSDAQNQLVTSGGRVLAITTKGQNISSALNSALSKAKLIQFDGKNYRTDIGKDLLPFETNPR